MFACVAVSTRACDDSTGHTAKKPKSSSCKGPTAFDLGQLTYCEGIINRRTLLTSVANPLR